MSSRKDEPTKVSRYIDRQEEHHRWGKLSDILECCYSKRDDWLEADPMKPPEGGYYAET